MLVSSDYLHYPTIPSITVMTSMASVSREGIINILHHLGDETAIQREPAPGNTSSRALLLAMSLCGALAGGSVVEGIAAIAARSSTPTSPTHLVAEPLAIAGAVCGGLLAAVIVSNDRLATDGHLVPEMAPLAATDTCPAEPMMWQPTPRIPQTLTESSTALTLAHTATSRIRRSTPRKRSHRAQSTRRAIRREG
jgi:hypothetical protein